MNFAVGRVRLRFASSANNGLISGYSAGKPPVTREGITRRYIRRLVNLALLSPQLVEAILQGRQPTELTATRLIELDLPLDWSEQRRLLAN